MLQHSHSKADSNPARSKALSPTWMNNSQAKPFTPFTTYLRAGEHKLLGHLALSPGKEVYRVPAGSPGSPCLGLRLTSMESKDLSLLRGVSSTVGRSPRHSRGTKAGMSFSPELGALASRDTDSGRHLDEHRNLLCMRYC